MPATIVEPATSRQMSYLRSLASQRNCCEGMDAAQAVSFVDSLASSGLSKSSASGLIDQWLLAPRRNSRSTGSGQATAEEIRDTVSRAAAEESARPVSERTFRTLTRNGSRFAYFGIHLTPARTRQQLEKMWSENDPALADLAAKSGRQGSFPSQPDPRRPFPYQQSEVLSSEDDEDGFYAAEVSGETRFYRIKDGKISRYKASSGYRLWATEVAAALADIRVNPAEAAFRFVEEFNRCWMCGRKLTDPASRLLGCGPICNRNERKEYRRFVSDRLLHEIGERADEDQGFRDSLNRTHRAVVRLKGGAGTASEFQSRVGAVLWTIQPGWEDLSLDEKDQVLSGGDDAQWKVLEFADGDVLQLLYRKGFLPVSALRWLMDNRTGDDTVTDLVNEWLMNSLIG